MQALPNDCFCGSISVFPKNWRSSKAPMNIKWYISYRFYDPAHDKPKQVMVKGMNAFNNRIERQSATKALLENEKDLLFNQGFNPFLGRAIAPQDDIAYEIDPSLPFVKAFKMAMERLTITPRVKVGIKSVIKGIEKAATILQYREVPISKLTRRHIKVILDQVGKTSKKWSNHRFNAYRGYLMMLYKELVELEAAPANPMWDISKKPVVKKIKKVLTEDERKKIDDHLAKAFPSFRNFIHLFFHSGGRKTELLQLKPSMIDLQHQTYRCIVKKGKSHREVDRTIKSIAIPFWKGFLQDCPDDHFLFGPYFKHAPAPMGEDSPTKYWKRYVKDQLGINVDFYSLKHLNTTEVVDAISEKAAALLNAHTSTAMVVDIYDVRQKDRQHQKLKEIKNSFA